MRRPDHPAPIGHGSANPVRWLPTANVRFSQATIGPTTRLDGELLLITDLAERFRQHGYVSEPIQVVRMPDGRLTSLDNRRLWAARSAVLPQIAVILHDPNDPFVAHQKRVKALQPLADIIDTAGELGPPGRLIARQDDQPTTMGEAIVFRCYRQRLKGLDPDFPLCGSITQPITQDVRLPTVVAPTSDLAGGSKLAGTRVIPSVRQARSRPPARGRRPRAPGQEGTGLER